MFNVRLDGGHLYGKQLFTWLSLVVSLMVSFVLSFFPLDVLDEIWDLIESVSEGFLTYFCSFCQAIAMVFIDMVKEMNFISTCAFVPILLYILCHCIYVLKFEIKYATYVRTQWLGYGVVGVTRQAHQQNIEEIK